MRTEAEKAEIKRRRAVVGSRFSDHLPYSVEPYATAVGYVARQATSAFARLDRLLSLNASSADAFCALHEAINHAGNLSKFFFPSRRSDSFASGRASVMREFFCVSDSSALNDRSLRDTLEHYDERLDDFFVLFDAGVLIVTPIIDEIPEGRDKLGTVFILMDPQKRKAAILGQSFDYGPINEACSEIAQKAPHKPY